MSFWTAFKDEVEKVAVESLDQGSLSTQGEQPAMLDTNDERGAKPKKAGILDKVTSMSMAKAQKGDGGVEKKAELGDKTRMKEQILEGLLGAAMGGYAGLRLGGHKGELIGMGLGAAGGALAGRNRFDRAFKLGRTREGQEKKAADDSSKKCSCADKVKKHMKGPKLATNEDSNPIGYNIKQRVY